ncbi:trypsin-like peptidase domain-containing protein [Pseudomonas putida]|nr:trypsin-like peptidase domain-containing protein [Pseudomonas putida]
MLTIRIFGLAGVLAWQPASAGELSTADPQPVSFTQGQSQHWTGIGRLSIGRSQCIASLIDSRPPDAGSDGPAYVVTAGHCVDQRNGVIGHDRPQSGSVTFNYFFDNHDQRVSVGLKRRVWSSMQGVDLALLELDTSLAALMAQGIDPLRLADSPASGSEVRVIGEPTVPDVGLRMGTCTQHDVPFVMELPWVWRHVLSNDCRGMAPGASGSPVLDPLTNQLHAIVNSVAPSRTSKPCTLNNPCQLKENEITRTGAINYAIPTRRLMGCFNEGKADLGRKDCQLLPGFELQVQGQLPTLRKITTDAEGQDQQPSWNLSFTLDKPRYRFKQTQDPLTCEAPEGYSGTIPAGEQPLDVAVGPEPGWHFLCLIGVDSPDERPSLALMGNSLSLATRLFPAAPVPTPQLDVQPLADGDVKVTWPALAPDQARFMVKRGPLESTDCNDPKGFRLLRHEHFVFPASKLPLRLCTFVEDVAGQRSAMSSDELQSATTR